MKLDRVMLLTRQKFASECDVTLERYRLFSKHKDNKYWYTIFQYQECAQYDIRMYCPMKYHDIPKILKYFPALIIIKKFYCDMI